MLLPMGYERAPDDEKPEVIEPEVSVIMYVKNGMPYFEKALKSVMDQTLHRIEILVIDAGSTDGTAEYIRQCQTLDSRIRLLCSPQGSVGAQFNLGVEKARGEYIGIVESDDFILPEMYEEQLTCAREYGCDVLRADNYIFFGDGEHEIRLRTKVSHKKSNYGRIMCAMQEPENVFIGGSFWTGLYKREFLIEKNIRMNETPGAAYQDFGFLFLTGALARSIYIMPQAFYCYRKDNPSSSCNRPSRWDMPVQEYRLLEKELKKRGIWDRYKEYFFLWKVRNERWFYFNLDQEGKRSFIHLFYEDMKEVAEESFLTLLCRDKEREFLENVKQGEKSLYDYLEGKDRIWEESVRKIEALDTLDVLETSRIYLFGAGNIGRILCWFLQNRNTQIRCQNKQKIAYVDNSRELWGMELEGVSVVPPQDALQSQQAFFIVCSENYAGEIHCQLKAAGVEDRFIAVCDDMDSCIRLIMRRTINICV